MNRFMYFLAVLLLLLIPHSAFGIEPDETGLKTGGELTVPVVVLNLQEAETNVGLTEADVLHEVELRFVEHGMTPAERETANVGGSLRQTSCTLTLLVSMIDTTKTIYDRTSRDTK